MNLFSSRLVLGLLCVAVAPAMALAQPGRGGGGARGGFGPGGNAGGVGALLVMQEVQAELKLTDEQKEKFREMQSELRGGGGGGGGGGAGGNREEFRNLSQEERDKRMAEFRTRMEERTKKIDELVKSTLTPEQLDRLNQLRIQQQGIQALSRAEVAAAIQLTDAQKEAIGEVLEAARPQRGAGGGFGRNASSEDRQKAMAEAQERRKKTQADIEAILTESQKAEWAKLQGAKFDFPERRGGGRGGEGGGQRGRRQRPPVEN